MFGAHVHKAPSGYAPGDAPYGSPKYITTDGMGTGHYAVVVTCVKCGKRFELVRFHVAKDKPLRSN